jgi:hypothetical protein
LLGAAEGRNQFLKKLEPLRSDLREKEGSSREVAARTSEIANEAGRHRVASDRHNDWYCRRRLCRCSGRRCAFCDDDVDLEPNQVRCETWEPVVVPVRKSVLDGEVPSLNVPEGAQRPPEDLDVGRDKGFGAAYEEPYSVAF